MQKNILVMIQSMTGYGKATAIFGEKKINVEIKSLNSKAMDLSTRIAPLYREKEMEIRNMTVSYTHLDVYKRQPFPVEIHFIILKNSWL